MARGRRRGTIEPKGPGKWLVRVPLGLDPVKTEKAGGKPRYARLNKLVIGTRGEAEAELTELLGRKDKGVRLPTGRRTLGQWLEEYEKTWSGHLSPRTQEQAKQILRLYLPSPFRSIRLADLSPAMLQDVYNGLLAAGKSPVTISLVHRTIRSRLSKAVELGLVAANVASLVSPPKIERRQYRVLTAEEARVFLGLADGTRFGALWVLLIYTGLRPEEALALTWDDVDFEAAMLRVRRALVRTKGKGAWQLREPKTGTGRAIALAAPALRALKAHRARQNEFRLECGEEYAPHNLVFTTEVGKPLDWRIVSQRYFRPLKERLALVLLKKPLSLPSRRGLTLAQQAHARKVFKASILEALSKTGLARLRPYDLRHSAASLLLAADEHPKVVQEMLGHSNISQTLDTYSHVIPGLQARAARKMEALLDEPEANSSARA